MDPMTIALLGSAVLGLNKSQEQQRNYKEMQKVEAVKEKWAPFTRRRGQTVQKPSATDPIMQALVAGAMMGQQFSKGAPGAEQNVIQPEAPGANVAATGVHPSGIPLQNAQQPASFGQGNYFAPYRPVS